MDSDFKRIEQAINAETGSSVIIEQARAIGGGCINQCHIVTLSDKRQFFVKSQFRPVFPDIFSVEYKSLNYLAEPNALTVPKPLVFGEDYLVMECMDFGNAAADWQEQMGRNLALLHQNSRHHQYGFETVTYLGTTEQINTWRDSWVAFWREQRLGWQLGKLQETRPVDDPLIIRGRQLWEKLDKILHEPSEGAVLLHGDLWSGNAAATVSGAPVIYDPACYYGHREAEFGMMRLFGGFGPRCEAAYNEVWPLENGFETRVKLYQLYHELNHVILFGNGYYNQSLNSINNLL